MVCSGWRTVVDDHAVERVPLDDLDGPGLVPGGEGLRLEVLLELAREVLSLEFL